MTSLPKHRTRFWVFRLSRLLEFMFCAFTHLSRLFDHLCFAVVLWALLARRDCGLFLLEHGGDAVGHERDVPRHDLHCLVLWYLPNLQNHRTHVEIPEIHSKRICGKNLFKLLLFVSLETKWHITQRESSFWKREWVWKNRLKQLTFIFLNALCLLLYRDSHTWTCLSSKPCRMNESTICIFHCKLFTKRFKTKQKKTCLPRSTYLWLHLVIIFHRHHKTLAQDSTESCSFVEVTFEDLLQRDDKMSDLSNTVARKDCQIMGFWWSRGNFFFFIPFSFYLFFLIDPTETRTFRVCLHRGRQGSFHQCSCLCVDAEIDHMSIHWVMKHLANVSTHLV